MILRNYEGVITTYQEPDDYKKINCDTDCDNCSLYLEADPQTDFEGVGVKRLLNNATDTIALVPNDNERMGKRDDE